MSDINLLTPEEKLDRTLSSVFQKVNIICAFLLLIFGGLSYYLFNQYNVLKSEEDIVLNELNALKTTVLEYQEEEQMLKNIETKYNTLSKFEETKIAYDTIFKDVLLRVPKDVSMRVKTITVNTERNQVAVRVVADSSSFKRYVDILKDQNLEGNDITKGIFSPSEIPEQVNEVTKEYVVTLRYNPGVLNVK